MYTLNAVPARIGDYIDFYTSLHHATNIGKQFRPDQPLLPNLALATAMPRCCQREVEEMLASLVWLRHDPIL